MWHRSVARDLEKAPSGALSERARADLVDHTHLRLVDLHPFHQRLDHLAPRPPVGLAQALIHLLGESLQLTDHQSKLLLRRLPFLLDAIRAFPWVIGQLPQNAQMDNPPRGVIALRKLPSMENKMPHLSVPEDIFRRLAAKAAALKISVDDLVQPALDRLAETGPFAPEPQLPLIGDAWHAEANAWKWDAESRASRYPPEFVLDDSRETLYREREDSQL